MRGWIVTIARFSSSLDGGTSLGWRMSCIYIVSPWATETENDGTDEHPYTSAS